MSALNPTLERLLEISQMNRRWVRGEGVWLEDDTGRRFLDLYAQYGAVALGHNPPRIVAALRHALDLGEPSMVQPYRAPHAEILAEALVRLVPDRLAHCLFTNSGAETVETAIQLVRARSERPIVLSAIGAFHGHTLAARAAAGGRHAEGFDPLPHGFAQVPFGDVQALEDVFSRDGERIAGFLVEPIQGERGVHLPPRGYLPAARELCRRHGVALVLDEIQTGLGRTGRMLACDHESVAPDVLLLSKALGGGLFPIGACLVTAQWWDPRFALEHSSTFANNNLAACVGRAVLDALHEERLCEAAAQRGGSLLSGLGALRARYPNRIREVRGRGLLCALELRPPSRDEGSFLVALERQGLYAYAVASVLAQEAGVLVLPSLGSANVLRVTPPLIIGEAEIELALARMERVFARLAENPVSLLARTLGRDHDRAPPRRVPVTLPRPRRAHTLDYAFLCHPTRPEDLAIANPGLDLDETELARLFRFLGQLPPLVACDAPRVHSIAGGEADGVIVILPVLPSALRERHVVEAVDLAASLGARVVGLGGHTTCRSRHGRAVVGRGPAITTGNGLTAGMAVATLARTIEEFGNTLGDCDVAVVGARGSLGGLCARLLARKGVRRLVLVGNPKRGHRALGPLAEEISRSGTRVVISLELASLRSCHAVISATSASAGVLEGALFAQGTVICDLGRPPDASESLRARSDVILIEGGLVQLPEPDLRFGAGNLAGLPAGVQLACLAETILLALTNRLDLGSLGRDLSVDTVDRLMELAAKHGFHPLASRSEPIPLMKAAV